MTRSAIWRRRTPTQADRADRADRDNRAAGRMRLQPFRGRAPATENCLPRRKDGRASSSVSTWRGPASGSRLGVSARMEHYQGWSPQRVRTSAISGCCFRNAAAAWVGFRRILYVDATLRRAKRRSRKGWPWPLASNRRSARFEEQRASSRYRSGVMRGAATGRMGSYWPPRHRAIIAPMSPVAMRMRCKRSPYRFSLMWAKV